MTAPNVDQQVARDAFLDPFAIVRARLEGDKTGEKAVMLANRQNGAGLIYGLTSLCAGLISELAESVGQEPTAVVQFMQAMSNEVVDSGLLEQLRPKVSDEE